MADSLLSGGVKENKLWKGVLAVAGIMTTLVIYGLLQVFFFFCFYV
jgi:adenosine 3'-phospho 5'-phosphosulfate transporter B2